MQIYFNQEELLAARGEDIVCLTVFLSWIALILFYAGYRSRFAKSLYLRLPQPPREWTPGTLLPYGFFLVILGIAGQLYFIFLSGGTQTYFSEARGAGAYDTTSAYIYKLQWLCVSGFAILFIETARKPDLVFKIVTYSLAVCFLVFQFISGQRSGVFLMALNLLAWHYLPRITTIKIPIVKTIVVTLLALSLVGFVASYRNEFYVGSDFKQSGKFFEKTFAEKAQQIYDGLIQAGGKTVINAEFDGFLQTLEAVPDIIDYDFGRYYTKYLYHWIPRSMWPEKPTIKEPMRDFIAVVPAFHHETITMLGMYHLNFGFAGIFFGSFLTGVVLGGLEYWRKHDLGNLGILLIYLVFFQIGRTFLMVGGMFEDLETYVPFFLLPCLGAFYYLKIMQKRNMRSFSA